jgi:hypothetical protein
MSKAAMGALVQFCGHDGYFLADIFVVAGANVVRASHKVTAGNITRPATGATHHLTDFPTAGFWRPELGVFVVPQDQVRELKPALIPPFVPYEVLR